jgi:hypothetical protein
MMNRFRVASAVLACHAFALLLVSAAARAETLQERVAAAQRRWAEYQELMQSSDPIARAEGFSAALADENLGIRNNALWSYLQRRDRLPVEVVLEPGGRVGPGDLPKVALFEVKWNAEQRALEGYDLSFGDRRPASGAVIAGKLQLLYPILKMPDFVGQSGNGAGATEPKMVNRRCDTTLAIDAARDALEGRLRCEGLPQTLPVRMPLG